MGGNGSLSQNYTNFLITSVAGLRFPYFMNFIKFLENAIFKASRVVNWVIASIITFKNILDVQKLKLEKSISKNPSQTKPIPIRTNRHTPVQSTLHSC